MAEQVVTYVSKNRLSCAGCVPSKVILCVRSELVSPFDCGTGAGTPATRRHVEALLVNYMKLQNGSCGYFYKYVFTYDDDQLITGAQLAAADIIGVFCEGCLTDWIKDTVGSEIQVEENTPGFITITTQHGCEYTFQRGWSTLERLVDDLVITYPDGTIETIPFGTGTNCADVLACINVANPISGDGSLLDPFTVDLSADPTNILTLNPDGLFVPTPAPPVVPINVIDTNSVDLTLAVDDLSANVNVSPAIGGRNNTLSIQAGGVYTPETRFTPLNTCVGGGVGAGWMLRSFNDVGNNDFQIGGAAEHTVVFNNLGYLDTTIRSLAVAATLDGNISLTLVINNASACRSMRVVMDGGLGVEITKPGGALNLFVRTLQSVNLGPFNIAAQSNYNFAAFPRFANGFQPLGDAVVLAPAGSVNWRIRSQVQVTTGLAGANWNTSSGGFKALGWTI